MADHDDILDDDLDMGDDLDMDDSDLGMESDDGQTVAFDDDDEDLGFSEESSKPKTSANKSPLATRGKSTSGNFLFGAIIFVVVSGAAVFGFLEYANPPLKAENLVHGNATDSQEAMEYFQDPKRNTWLENRISRWLKHHRVESRQFGARLLTNRALGLDSTKRTEAVQKLRDVLAQESIPDVLAAEVIHNLGRIGQTESGHGATDLLAQIVLSNEGGRSIKDRDLRNTALETLNDIPGSDTDVLLLGVLENFHRKDLKDLSTDDRDLRYKVYRMLCARLEATVNETTETTTSGETWDHQLKLLHAVMEGCVGDTAPPKVDDLLDLNDHRIREVCWETIDRLTSNRALQLWVELLRDKDDLINRTVAVTMLRRVSDRVFGYDPMDPDSDVSEWSAWVESATP